MAKPKRNVEEEEVVVDEEVIEEEEEVVSKGGDSVTIAGRTIKGEEITRTFSKAVHGADFKKLAEEFKGKFNGKVV